MRKIVLYISMSLDGYIARKDKSIDWILGNDEKPVTDTGYDDFIKDISSIIMGRNTFEQVVNELSPGVWPYADRETVVCSHHALALKKQYAHLSSENIVFTKEPIATLVNTLQSATNQGDIWLLGGAELVNAFMIANIIDIYHITIIPRILGEGIALFKHPHPQLPLFLEKQKYHQGMVELVYRR